MRETYSENASDGKLGEANGNTTDQDSTTTLVISRESSLANDGVVQEVTRDYSTLQLSGQVVNSSRQFVGVFDESSHARPGSGSDCSRPSEVLCHGKIDVIGDRT
jgi:hypothetical protein